MLLRRATRQGLEPVGVVGCALLHCPFLHTDCHAVGDVARQSLLIVHQVKELLQHVAGDILLHLFAREHFLCEQLACAATCGFYLHRLMTPCGLQSLKTNVTHITILLLVVSVES